MAVLQGVVEFVAAADAGSFSGAARTLGLSVAHVSRQVAELERGLGLQLIQRTTRRSVLTDAGRSYYESCRALLEGLEEARDGLRRDQNELRGPVRVSVGGHFAEAQLSPLMLRFAAAHPAITLEFEVSSRNVDLVEEGVDFAVRAGPLAASNLRLVSFPLVTLAAPEVRDRLGDLRHPSQLDPALCLSLGHRRWTFRRGAEEHAFAPRGRIHSNSGSTLVQAAAGGMGIVQLPGYYGREEVRAGQLLPLLGDWTAREPFEFHIVYPPQSRLPQRVRRLIDFLVAEMPG
ncbi:LysR family transcriptional regulator [Pseudoroseomonas cervicalis]|uniref:LysR family transcriptional regulator n=1 Tax=Teichococcus cervicalis TaxID=204525 RepID=UPI0022F1C16F|nr:LysR family transcriptional regulator [Pseudoroseomonas cervicalis]WBV42555.1 LysR family transcriptional regulator [Pseudoroseomonas cervicalis]